MGLVLVTNSKSNVVDVLNVDGVLYTEEIIRDLKERYEYNKETLTMLRATYLSRKNTNFEKQALTSNDEVSQHG